MRSLKAFLLNFMWRGDVHGVADFVMECFEVNINADPDMSQPSDQSFQLVAGSDVLFLPSSLSECVHDSLIQIGFKYSCGHDMFDQ